MKQRCREIQPTLLKAIAFADPFEGWAVGFRNADAESRADKAVILHTWNGGESWEEQITNTSDLLVDVAALSYGHAWAVGDNGTVLRTVDHGEHWSPVKLPGKTSP